MNKIKIVSGPPNPPPLDLIVCMPGNNFSGNFVDCWSEFLQQSIRNNIRIKLSRAEDAVVYYVRNKCLGGNVLSGVKQKPFGESQKYDYMLWIDSDTIFSFHQFMKLLSHRKDIIGGLYLMRGGQQFATVREWDLEFFRKNGFFKFLEIKDIKGKKDIFEVAYSGFGFMLIKYGVFESMDYPWFRPLTQKIGEGIEDFSSEDVSFCRIAVDKGYKIYIDPTVIVGHEKKVIYLPPRLENSIGGLMGMKKE